MNPTGYHSAPTPLLTTSPAIPRNDAADRYSPDTAAALNAGEIRREATRKSEVVRIAATPRAPMSSVASTTGTTASAITARPGLVVGREVPLGGLRTAQLPPRQPGEHRPRQHRHGQPGHRDAETAGRRPAPVPGRAPAAGPRGTPPRPAAPSRRVGAAGGGSARPAPARRPPGGARGRPARVDRRARRGSAGWSPPPGAAIAGRDVYSPRRPTRTSEPQRCPAAPTSAVRLRRAGHRPSFRAPGSNTPRVAASSSRSRSSRAWRRLTGTSPTSVCASRPPLTSLRSSCTACTASR